VAGISLSNRSKVDPSAVWFKADYDSPFARALLANSITLTPGTITIDITDEGYYSVHALTQHLKEGILDGSMQKKVAWAYKEKIDFRPLSEEEIAGIDVIEHEITPRKYRARRKKK
jgi:multicomponent Na+:H+ antiporter subunit E